MKLLNILVDGTPKSYKFSTTDFVEINDNVVIETDRGLAIGTVKKIENSQESIVPKIVRRANEKDVTFWDSKFKLEDMAFIQAARLVKEMGLVMKIAKVRYMLHSTKVIFYFTSENRVDFRALVRKLASLLHSRIEMRQIGVRDKAQMIGGMGVCGRDLCCHSFIDQFSPVSLDDARKTNMNTDKLIGVCGRFMCCLHFELCEDKNCNDCDSKRKADTNLEKKKEYKKKEYKKKEYKKKEYKKKDYVKKDYVKKDYVKKDYVKKDYVKKDYVKKDYVNKEKITNNQNQEIEIKPKKKKIYSSYKKK